MERKQSAIEPKHSRPASAHADPSPASADHPTPSSERRAPARDRTARDRIIWGQWLALALLLVLLVAAWAPTWSARMRARQTNKAQQQLLASLYSPDAVVRALAARDLQRFKDPSVSQALVAILKDPEWPVRYEAILSLGLVGGDGAADEVTNYLGDENPNVQEAAVTTLGRLAAPSTLTSLVQTYLYDERLRPKVKAALETLREPHTSFLLMRALSEADPNVRAVAARGLSDWGDTWALGPLSAGLSDPEPAVRKESVTSLGAILVSYSVDEPAYIALVAAAVADTDADVRQQAVLALGTLKIKDDVTPIVTALQDTEPAVRLAALGALKECRPPQTIPLLLERLDDSDPQVRAAALALLGELRAVSATEAVLGRLDDEEASVRGQAVRTLAALRDPRALRPLQDALGKKTVPPYEVMVALGELGDLRAVPLLLEQVRSDDHRVRVAAGLALTKLDSPTVERELIKIYETETRPYVRSDVVMLVQKIRAQKKG